MFPNRHLGRMAAIKDLPRVNRRFTASRIWIYLDLMRFPHHPTWRKLQTHIQQGAAVALTRFHHAILGATMRNAGWVDRKICWAVFNGNKVRIDQLVMF